MEVRGNNSKSAPAVDPVVDRIYEASLDPQQWPAALAAMARELGAESAFFFSTHSETDPGAVLHVHNHPVEMVREFDAYWHTQDEWALAARRTGGMVAGLVVLSEDLVPREQLRRTPFFNDFLRRYDIESMAGAVVFDGTDADRMPVTHICWYRPPGEPGFERQASTLMRRRLPHVQRALRIQRRIAQLAEERSRGTLGALHMAGLVLDARGAIHHCNAEGKALIDALPAGCVRHGTLRALGARCVPSVAEALAACTGSTPARLHALLPGPRPVVVGATLLRLPAEHSLPIGTSPDERFLLLVDWPRAEAGRLAATVARLFKLSPAEARVLTGLLEGASPGEIAASAGTSLTTVRTQISSLLVKTGTKGQTDLLLLLRGLRG